MAFFEGGLLQNNASYNSNITIDLVTWVSLTNMTKKYFKIVKLQVQVRSRSCPGHGPGPGQDPSLKQTQNWSFRVIISKVGTWRDTIIKCPTNHPPTQHCRNTVTTLSQHWHFHNSIKTLSQCYHNFVTTLTQLCHKTVTKKKSQKRLKRNSWEPLLRLPCLNSNIQCPHS